MKKPTGQEPKREMTPEHKEAMTTAIITMVELAPKFKAGLPLTPWEGLKILGELWAVYLFEIAAGHRVRAAKTSALTDKIAKYLEYCGYVVTFEDDGYCITWRSSLGND